jgi:endonuclease-3
MAQGVAERFGGKVPSAIEDLVTLPGVGRKTANVVRSVWFDEPGLPVDTHVTRLSHRLGLTEETDPVKIEFALNALVPAAERGGLSLRLILHGRRVCDARSPKCDVCVLERLLSVVTPASQTLSVRIANATCTQEKKEYDGQHQPGSRHLV